MPLLPSRGKSPVVQQRLSYDGNEQKRTESTISPSLSLHALRDADSSSSSSFYGPGGGVRSLWLSRDSFSSYLLPSPAVSPAFHISWYTGIRSVDEEEKNDAVCAAPNDSSQSIHRMNTSQYDGGSTSGSSYERGAGNQRRNVGVEDSHSSPSFVEREKMKKTGKKSLTTFVNDATSLESPPLHSDEWLDSRAASMVRDDHPLRARRSRSRKKLRSMSYHYADERIESRKKDIADLTIVEILPRTQRARSYSGWARSSDNHFFHRILPSSSEVTVAAVRDQKAQSGEVSPPLLSVWRKDNNTKAGVSPITSSFEEDARRCDEREDEKRGKSKAVSGQNYVPIIPNLVKRAARWNNEEKQEEHFTSAMKHSEKFKSNFSGINVESLTGIASSTSPTATTRRRIKNCYPFHDSSVPNARSMGDSTPFCSQSFSVFDSSSANRFPLLSSSPTAEASASTTTFTKKSTAIRSAKVPSTAAALHWNLIVLLLLSSLCSSFSYAILSILMNKELNYDAVAATKFWLVVSFASWSEPVIGILTDSVVLCGERRRPLFILSCIGNAIIYALFGTVHYVTEVFHVFAVLSFISQLFIVTKFVSLSAILMNVGVGEGETTKESSARICFIQSKARTWRSTGMFVGALLQALFFACFSVHTMLGITSFLYAILLFPILSVSHIHFIPRPTLSPLFGASAAPFSEVRAPSPSSTRCIGKKRKRKWFSRLWKSVRSGGLHHASCGSSRDKNRFAAVLFFVFLYSVLPNSSVIYQNYLFTFDFPTWYYAALNCIGHCGNAVGSFLFSLWIDFQRRKEIKGVKRCSTSLLFCIGSLSWAAGYVTSIMICTGWVENTLHLSLQLFILLDIFIFCVFEVWADAPIVLASTEYAPQGSELLCAQIFSVVSMAGRSLSSALTLGLLRVQFLHDSLWKLTFFSILCRLLIVPLTYFLPSRDFSSLEESVTFIGAADVFDDKNHA